MESRVKPRDARQQFGVCREHDDAIDAPRADALEPLRRDVPGVQVKEPRAILARVGEDALQDLSLGEVSRRNGDEDVRRG